jgi:hypothetical protein
MPQGSKERGCHHPSSANDRRTDSGADEPQLTLMSPSGTTQSDRGQHQGDVRPDGVPPDLTIAKRHGSTRPNEIADEEQQRCSKGRGKHNRESKRVRVDGVALDHPIPEPHREAGAWN